MINARSTMQDILSQKPVLASESQGLTLDSAEETLHHQINVQHALQHKTVATYGHINRVFDSSGNPVNFQLKAL